MGERVRCAGVMTTHSLSFYEIDVPPLPAPKITEPSPDPPKIVARVIVVALRPETSSGVPDRWSRVTKAICARGNGG